MAGIVGLIRREGVIGRWVEEIFLGSQNLGEPITSQRPAHSTCVSFKLGLNFWWHKRCCASCHWEGPFSHSALSSYSPLPASIWLWLSLKEGRQLDQLHQMGLLSQLRMSVPAVLGLPRAADTAAPDTRARVLMGAAD